MTGKSTPSFHEDLAGGTNLSFRDKLPQNFEDVLRLGLRWK